MHPILEYIYNLLPPDKKQKANGEISFNGVCCYRSEKPDTKKRGGVKFFDDGFVYNCFNCKFSCGFTLGKFLSKKCVQFLRDCGSTSEQITTLFKMIDEYNSTVGTSTKNKELIKPRIIRDIPTEYKSIKESLYKGENSKTLKKIYTYISQRNERLLSWADLLWAEGRDNFLIPCYEFNKIVGYSLRSIHDESEHKYIHYVPSGYIFNFDNLTKDRKYQIVVEGQTDALAINGLALLSNVFTPEKLKRLLEYKGNSEIILVPDRDKPGLKMIQQLLDENLPFSVSFPSWQKGIKDVEDAVKRYGRLYTIYDIIKNKESDKNKIKIKMGGWIKE